jgi:hypothetical protein
VAARAAKEAGVSAHGREHEHLERPERGERGIEPPEPDPVERVASQVGNRAFAELARHGEGILPDGRAHPDVERAIAARRGGGRALDGGVRSRMAPGLGDELGDVRVHDGAEADALARSVQARAFTVGSDLFFAEGEHRPGTAAGDRLLAHELTHVVQQRGAPAQGPLTVSEPGDASEHEADQAADELAG